MIEIELSYIWGNDDPTFVALTEEFGQQHGVKVRLRRLDWATAWVDLFTMASQGHGSDVSSIGSTWVSTLAKLDALRPFKSEEVAEMGATTTFVAPAWQSTKLFGDQHVWAIPTTGWMYVICYRKSLLQSIGIDPSKAFVTPQSIQDTLNALKTSALEIPWLNPDVPHPYGDFIHTAASWVWAAGGDFLNPAGDKALFDSPQAISGLANWLNTYRCVPEAYQHLHMVECADLFMSGRAAAAQVDILNASKFLNTDHPHLKQEEIGFSNLTDTPWWGGGHFVVWDHTRSHPERERAAVELVKFLTGKEASLQWSQKSGFLPARLDVLNESYPPGNPLRDTVVTAARQGRSYFNASHWRRVETQFCLELGATVKEVRENPDADATAILRARLEPLARRLNIILER